MSTIKNIAFMGVSTAIRLGCGMFTFIVMARLLGPDSFGVIMLWLSVGTLLTMAANFGLTPYLLREIGANPDKAEELMSEVLTVKFLLTSIIIVVAFLLLTWVKQDQRLVFFLIIIALLFDSLTDFLNVGFRATNRFASETRIASITSLSQFIIVVSALFFQNTVLMASLAFLISRVLTTTLTWSAQRNYFKSLRPASFLAGLSCIKKTYNYAIDYSLQSLFGQIDSLVLNHFIGPAAVGVYQAGMRVFMGGAQAAPVLANVFLPKASAVSATKDKNQFSSEVKNIQLVFVCFGALFGLALAIFSELIVNLLFGREFSALIVLFPWFGLLFFVRFFASAWGVVLTSAGLQRYRTWVNGAQWIACLCSVPFLVGYFGSVGWLMSLIFGQTLLSLGYYYKGRQIVAHTGKMVICSIVLFMAFIPLVKFA